MSDKDYYNELAHNDGTGCLGDISGDITSYYKLSIIAQILAIIERRDDPAVKLLEIKEILERVKDDNQSRI
jgi:hypothetical protein